MKNTIIGLFTLLTLLACIASQRSLANDYKITNRIALEGDGFWDYLAIDESTQRLFVSHGTEVQVVYLKTGKLVATIPDTKGVHGIALAPDLDSGFISCGKDTTVTVFNLSSMTTIQKIKVTGANPDAILYDRFSKRIYTFNHNGKNATVIDGLTSNVVATIELGGEPEFAVTDGQGMIFVNLEDKSEIAVIDAKTMKVVHNWPISPGKEPTGLALDIKNNRLFAVCGNKKMVVVDSKTGRVVQHLPIGDGADGVVFDPTTQRIYSANGAGNMTVVEAKTPDKYRVIATVPTQKGARTIAFNAVTQRLYLPTAEREPADGDARPKVKPGTFVVLEVGEIK